ncbi:MAG: serine/threonine-protein kinase [Acidobacteriota bacterium]
MPKRLGPYVLIEPIGRGGMGRVFLAEQRAPMRRHVAIKILDRRTTRLDRARFEVERQALARLGHPHVAQIFDAGTTEEGLPYLVMEYVDGPDLIAYARDRNLDLEARLRLFLPICRAIEHAHRRGLIHRDLKPSNLLVAEVDGRAVPKVIDFGVAKAVSPGADGGLTKGGTLVGTPKYMSPEQILSEGEQIDTRADVYCLGLVLYQLLTGAGPFANESQDVLDMLRILLQEEPRKPSSLPNPSAVRRALAVDLDWVLLRALAKQPDDRYPTAEALADDLCRFLDGLPVKAHPPSWIYRFRKGLARQWRAATVGVLALTGLVVALGWGVQTHRESTERARLAERFGQRVARFEHLLRLEQTVPLHDLRPAKATTRAGLRAIRAEADAVGGFAEAIAAYALGRGHLALGDIATSRRHLERAWALGHRSPENAEALGHALGEAYRQARDEAVQTRDVALRAKTLETLALEYHGPIRSYLDAARPSGSARAAYTEARLALYEGRLDDALRHARAAADTAPWLFEALILEGDVELRRAQNARLAGDDSAAREWLGRASAAFLHATRVGESAPDALAGACRIGVEWLYLDLYGQPVDDLGSRVDTARTGCERARTADSERDDLWHLSANLERLWAMDALRKRRDEIDPGAILDSAEAAARRAIDRAPDRASHHLLLGRILRERGRAGLGSDPAADHRASLDTIEQARRLDPSRVDVISALGIATSDLAWRLRRGGEDAGAAFDRAAALLAEAADGNPSSYVAHYNLGIAYRARAAWSEVRGEDPTPWFDLASDSYRRCLDLHPEYVFAWSNLAFAEASRAAFTLDAGNAITPALDATFETALDATERALTLRPDLLSLWANRGHTLELRGLHRARRGDDPIPDWRAALDAYRRTVLDQVIDDLTFDPEVGLVVARIHLRLGQALAERDEARTARRHLDRADTLLADWSDQRVPDAIDTEELAEVREQRRQLAATLGAG